MGVHEYVGDVGGGMRGGGKTHRIVVQRGVDTPMSFDLVTRADERAHLPPAREGSLQRLEPVCVGISSFVVGCAEGFECADNHVMILAIIVVLCEG